MVGARVLQRVGQPLLHDAIRREVDRRRERKGRPSTCNGRRRPARPTSSTSASRCSRPGCGASSTSSPSRRIAPSRRRISASAVRPVSSTPWSASASSAERFGKLVTDGTDLKHHHADGVGDDVVELAGDACALLRDRDPRRRISLPLGVVGALLPPPRPRRRARGRVKPASQPIANRSGVKTSSAGSVGRVVVDDDRRTAEHDGQPEPRLHGVAEIAEQERRGHPGDERADGEDDQAPVDERERRAEHPDRRRARRRGNAGGRAAAAR